MASFGECKAGMDSVAERINQDRKRTVTGPAMIAQASADLAAIPSSYSDVVTSIDAGLAANPTNPAWMAIKAEKDLLVAEYQALKTEADAMTAALDAL